MARSRLASVQVQSAAIFRWAHTLTPSLRFGIAVSTLTSIMLTTASLYVRRRKSSLLILGAQQGVQRLLDQGTVHDSTGILLTQMEPCLNGKTEIAVRDGPSFRDWATIVQQISSPAWFCTCCLKIHACGHLTAVRGKAPQAIWHAKRKL